MTKSVTIVNTSNWKGENVEIKMLNRSNLSESQTIILKPGESEYLGERCYGSVEIRDIADKHTEPMMRQVTPKLKVKIK